MCCEIHTRRDGRGAVLGVDGSRMIAAGLVVVLAGRVDDDDDIPSALCWIPGTTTRRRRKLTQGMEKGE